jgi:YbgC/YbaW family acyl-CoA thioester hydrolase
MTNLGRTLWMIAQSPRRTPCPEVGPCETPFRVLPTDLDFLLHMNNAVYFQVMDIARGDWLVRSKVWQRLRKKKLHLVVSDETIQFRKSLTLGQKFAIETKVVGWDEKAFFVEQRFVRNGELWANALVRLRALDAAQKPVRTDEVLPILDAAHVPSPPLPEWVTSWMQTQGALRTSMRPVRAA